MKEDLLLPYDLKPPPVWADDSSWLWWSISLSAIVVATMLYYFFRKNRRITSNNAVPSLLDANISQLESALTNEVLSISQFASELSLCIRIFLERELAFPASDLTANELTSQLQTTLEQRFPFANNSHKQRLHQRTLEILRHLEFVSFANAALPSKNEILEWSRLARQLRALLDGLADSDRANRPVTPVITSQMSLADQTNEKHLSG